MWPTPSFDSWELQRWVKSPHPPKTNQVRCGQSQISIHTRVLPMGRLSHHRLQKDSEMELIVIFPLGSWEKTTLSFLCGRRKK